MRFHVPNNELELYHEEKVKAKEQAEESKDKPASDDESDDDMTAAKLFDDKIHKKANIGEFAGAVVASI